MEYKGKLYAKVGRHYFPLTETTDDIDKLKLRVAELKKQLEVNKISFNSVLADESFFCVDAGLKNNKAEKCAKQCLSCNLFEK